MTMSVSRGISDQIWAAVGVSDDEGLDCLSFPVLSGSGAAWP